MTLVASIIVALLFIVLSMPFMYKLTNIVFSKVNLITMQGNAPTMQGIVLHGVVAGVLYMILVKIMRG